MVSYYENRILARQRVDKAIKNAVATDPKIEISLRKLINEVTLNIPVGEKVIKQQVQILIDEDFIKMKDSDLIIKA